MAETASKKKTAKEIFEALKAELDLIDPVDEPEKYEAKGKEMQKAAQAYYSEKVKLKLPRARGNESRYVSIGWNMKDYRIERGVEVEVPRAVVEIYESSEAQKDNAYAYMDALADEYERSK